MSRLNTFLRISCLLYIYFNPNFNFGQEKTITGKVQNSLNDVSNVLVVNLSSKKSTITDSLGLFTIEVKLKDSIQFTAVQYQRKQMVITDSIFDQKFLFVNLIENIINLEEVVVTPYNLSGKLNFDIESLNIKPTVNSSTLGLPNANIYVMTQSERLLLEADRGEYITIGFGFALNTHKIMNRVSGRTKSLEERLVRDKIMKLEKEIIAKFSKYTISESLDIPETNIDEFLTYCMLQEDFLELSKWSTTEVWEYLSMKSIEFKETDTLKN